MLRRRPPPQLPDEERERHPSWRRHTRKYRRKKRVVRNIWLAGALVTVTLPVAAIPVLLLGATFISFMILDETA